MGGRTLFVRWHNQTLLELGASIILVQNAYMRCKPAVHLPLPRAGLSAMLTCRDWAQRLGLKRKVVGDTDDVFAIWNGHEFVFNQSSWTVVTASSADDSHLACVVAAS